MATYRFTWTEMNHREQTIEADDIEEAERIWASQLPSADNFYTWNEPANGPLITEISVFKPRLSARLNAPDPFVD